MIVGYITEVALAFLLALFLYCIHHTKLAFVSRRHLPIFTHGFSTFFDTAIFFSFSVQVASIVVLSRYGFGISASGMGSNTVQITWAISQLVLLPLTLPMTMQHVMPESPKTTLDNSKQKQLQVVLFS